MLWCQTSRQTILMDSIVSCGWIQSCTWNGRSFKPMLQRSHNFTVALWKPVWSWQCHSKFSTQVIAWATWLTNPDGWNEIESVFCIRWDVPNALGARDRKHVAIRCPRGGSSEFFNYKNFHSIVLLALVDANYRFIWLPPCQRNQSNQRPDALFRLETVADEAFFPAWHVAGVKVVQLSDQSQKVGGWKCLWHFGKPMAGSAGHHQPGAGCGHICDNALLYYSQHSAKHLWHPCGGVSARRRTS